MYDTEYKMFNQLISCLEQAKNLLCSDAQDCYAMQHKARFVDSMRITLEKARKVRENSIPIIGEQPSCRGF